MTKYQAVLMHTGPDRWTYAVLRVGEGGRTKELCHGMAKTRDEAEAQARAWATWFHEQRTKDSYIERIDIELD